MSLLLFLYGFQIIQKQLQNLHFRISKAIIFFQLKQIDKFNLFMRNNNNKKKNSKLNNYLFSPLTYLS